MIIFVALTCFIFFSSILNNEHKQEERASNTSFQNPQGSLTEKNYFYGLNSYQEHGNDILELSFGNLLVSNVNTKINEETISIEVNKIENAIEYQDTKFLNKNIAVSQSGNTLRFTIDKAGLTRRCLVQQYDDSIRLKILSPNLVGKRITIDPGHGGVDPGAMGPTGLLEKDVVLDISLRLYELLEQAGADVVLTRDSDDRAFPGTYRGDLEQRAKFAIEYDTDMFISVHNNASEYTSARGVETLFNQRTVNASQSKEFALILQQHLAGDLNSRDRGVVNRDIQVLKPNNYVAVLTEILFITSPVDEKMMKTPDFAERAAQSIFNAIKDYYSN